MLIALVSKLTLFDFQNLRSAGCPGNPCFGVMLLFSRGYTALSLLFEIQVTLISMSLVVGSLWFAPVHPLGLKKIEASNFELISFAFYVSHLVICR